MVGINFERKLRDDLRKQGWVVFRSAGSHVADLIALKPNDHMIIEVKSVGGNKYYTSSDKEQFNLLNEYAKQKFKVFYYIWFKGKRNGWQRYQLPLEPYPVFKYTLLLK